MGQATISSGVRLEDVLSVERSWHVGQCYVILPTLEGAGCCTVISSSEIIISKISICLQIICKNITKKKATAGRDEDSSVHVSSMGAGAGVGRRPGGVWLFHPWKGGDRFREVEQQ